VHLFLSVSVCLSVHLSVCVYMSVCMPACVHRAMRVRQKYAWRHQLVCPSVSIRQNFTTTYSKYFWLTILASRVI